MSNELWWYVARSCGLVSWTVLTASVLWGLLLSSKSFRQRFTAAWVLDLHRYLGGLGVVFLGLHIAGLVQDKYVHFGIASLLVPLASRWRPGAVALGVASMYLLLAVELTSLVRRRLPARVWRITHGLAFPLFAMATVHLLAAGTDARIDALRWGAVSALAVVVLATSARLLTVRQIAARRRAAADALVARHADRVAARRADDRFARREAAIAAAKAARQRQLQRERETADHLG